MKRDEFHVWLTVDVRWGDMDAFGHVNNARYFTYCESARIRYFQELGLDLDRAATGRAPAGRPDTHAPAVVSASCNFLRQVHYPATLDVGVRVTEVGRSSFTLDYGIFRHDSGELVADGQSVAVWVDYAAGKSAPLPEELKAKIRAIDPGA